METTEQLLKAFLDGNESAFKVLVEENEDLIYNVVLSIVKNEADAADVTQDVFVKVFEKATSFRGESQASTWLYRIAVNTALDFNKRKRSHHLLSFANNLLFKYRRSSVSFNHPGVLLENKDHAHALFDALDKLPGKQQAAFVLFYMEEKSQREVAEILGLSVSAVESLMSRAKQKLQRTLFNYYNRQKNEND